MLARTGQREPARAKAPTLARHRNLLRARQVLAGQRTFRDARHGAGEHDLSATLAAAGSELHHIVGSANRVGVVLDDEYGVARLAQAREKSQQPRHVARVKADRWLIEHVQRVDELRAERVREPDALCFAAGKRSRGPVHREVVQADVAQELHAVARLLHEVAGDAALELREGQMLQPVEQLVHRQLGHLRDGAIGDAHLQCVRLQLRAPAGGADSRGLVAAQENADVLLVALLLEVLEEGKDALEAARARMEQLLARARRQARPRLVQRNALAAAELGERATLVVVAWHRPWIDGAVAHRPFGMRDDEAFVVLEHRTEPVAFDASAARAIEGEQLRRRRWRARAVIRTFEALGEAQHRSVFAYDRAVSVAFTERRRHGVRQAATLRILHAQPIDDDEQLRAARQIDRAAFEVLEVQRPPVGANANEALGTQILDDDLVRDGVRQPQREGDREADPVAEREHGVRDGLHRIRAQLTAAHFAVGAADASPEQPQVIVDLRSRADGGAGRLGRVLLLDGDGGREPLNDVDVGFLHPFEKLPRIRRQRFDVAPLAFGVNGVEGERRFPRSGRAGDDGEGTAGDVEVDPLEIVLAGAPNLDRVLHGGNLLPRTSRRSAAGGKPPRFAPTGEYGSPICAKRGVSPRRQPRQYDYSVVVVVRLRVATR
ncbi:MAG TPA: hypothetical protein VJ867_07220 [Gemmatimonadaceae bacterium]|nr:hypothetical protein [Gemmatimonadaceae bacterium]